nr:nitroreductase family protein [uncultured Flavobacterium sp.]
MDVTKEKSVSEAIKYRRSVRVFTKEAIEEQKVKECIQLASLAPTSSNMQLWEFYHIVSPEIIQQIAGASFDQNAAKTAQQIVIVIARKDLWKKRVQSNIAYLKNQYGDKPAKEYTKREKFALNYCSVPLHGFFRNFRKNQILCFSNNWFI